MYIYIYTQSAPIFFPTQVLDRVPSEVRHSAEALCGRHTLHATVHASFFCVARDLGTAASARATASRMLMWQLGRQ